MRKAILILSTTTVLFAALSIYLALRLRARDEAPPPVAQAVAACRTLEPIATTTIYPAVRDAGITPASGCDPQREKVDRANAETQARYLAQLRLDLADPVKRAQLIDQGKRMLRVHEPRLAAYMGMKDAEFDAFLALLAEHNMAYTEAFARCSPNCGKTIDPDAMARRKQNAIRDLLGAEGGERYTRYEESRAERMAVDTFRGSLPDKLGMTDGQYEQLIAALADERQKFHREVASRGLETRGMGAGRSMLYWDENQRSVEERVAAARQYSERLQSRAAAVLTAEQARHYAEGLESELANMENNLPWHDAMNAQAVASKPSN